MNHFLTRVPSCKPAAAALAVPCCRWRRLARRSAASHPRSALAHALRSRPRSTWPTSRAPRRSGCPCPTWTPTTSARWTTPGATTPAAPPGPDPARGVRMLHAEFPPARRRPRCTLTSTVQTRNRAVDWAGKRPPPKTRRVLKLNLAPPICCRWTASCARPRWTPPAVPRTDVQKVQALYNWVIANAHREPKTRGCGTRRHQDHAGNRQPGRQVRRPERLFVGLCRAGRAGARRLRPAPGALGLRLPRARRQPRQPQGRAALPRRGLPAPARLGGDGPGRRAEGDAQETPDWIKDPRTRWWPRWPRACSAPGKATGWRGTRRMT
jgi:hypothetical protein